MSNKANALDRYTKCLNEMITITKEQGSFKKVGSFAEKYGMSPEFFSFLVKEGILHREGAGVHAQFSIGDGTPMTLGHVQPLMSKWNRVKNDKKQGRTTEAPVRFNPGSKMSELTTGDLLRELKRRGYTGTLTIKKTIKL